MTYNNGFKIVRDKCNQKYNTSSADEQINAAIYRRQHPVLAMQNQGNIEHIFAKSNPNSKKTTQNKEHKNIEFSSKKSSDGNGLSAQTSRSSSATPSKSSPVFNRKQNSHSERHEREKGENDLRLDDENICLKSAVSVNDETGSIPEIRPNREILMENSVPIRNLNQSQTSQPRSIHSRSDGSRSSRSRSKMSRSSSHPSIRSQSSRSSNITRLSRPDSSRTRHSSSNKPRQSRSRSIESSPQTRKHNSNFGVKNTSIDKANARMERIVKSNVNVSESNTKNKRSATSYSSHKSHSSRSRSIHSVSSRSRSRSSIRSISRSSRFHSRSKSRTPRSGSSTTIRQKTNKKQHRHQLQADARGKRGPKIISNKGMKASANFIDGQNKRRRSLESNTNKTSRSEINSKRPRISVQCSRSRRSTSEYSQSRSRRSFTPSRSPQQSFKNLHKHDTAASHRRRNNTLHDPQSNLSTSSKINSTTDLMNVVKKLTETVSKSSRQLRDNDRRFQRMEVTVNKIFVLVGDLHGNAGPIHDELVNDKGFLIPELPIYSTNELALIKRKLKDKEFRSFLVSLFLFDCFDKILLKIDPGPT